MKQGNGPDCGHRCCQIRFNQFHSHPVESDGCERCIAVAELVNRLTATATDTPRELAAVTVLAVEGFWLSDPAFCHTCIERIPSGSTFVAWRRVRPHLVTRKVDPVRHELLLFAAEVAETGVTDRLHQPTLRNGLHGTLRDEIDKAVTVILESDPPST